MSCNPPNIKEKYKNFKKNNKPNRIKNSNSAGKKARRISFSNPENNKNGINSKKLIEALVKCKGCDNIWDGYSQCPNFEEDCGLIEDVFLIEDDETDKTNESDKTNDTDKTNEKEDNQL